jgi:colanic acid biosynthesis glycosyl transferase WcaI
MMSLHHLAAASGMQGKTAKDRRPRVTLLYHYFYPDDVVSARHFTELGRGLVERGWRVQALACNRGCRDETLSYPLEEEWEQISIRRIWRPRFRQATGRGKVMNAAWMLSAWCAAILRDRRNRPDVLLIGADPPFSILVAPVVRKLLPDIRIVHWCFDLHPEYAIADGMFQKDSWVIRGLNPLLRKAYACCDLLVDLGSCMRTRLEEYGPTCRKTTLIPWALAEPAEVERPDLATRHELFGDNPLGLLYSGSFGRAHSYADLFGLARRLRGTGIQFAFGVRGNKAEELRKQVQPEDTNVSLAGFAPEAALVKRLAAADIHLASLRPEYTGAAVPSKFFGSLASGRPVIFSGTEDSAIAGWIKEFKIGWVLNERTQEGVAAELLELRQRRDKLQALQQHCFQVYHQHFSFDSVLNEWDRQLRGLVRVRPSCVRFAAPRSVSASECAPTDGSFRP